MNQISLMMALRKAISNSYFLKQLRYCSSFKDFGNKDVTNYETVVIQPDISPLINNENTSYEIAKTIFRNSTGTEHIPFIDCSFGGAKSVAEHLLELGFSNVTVTSHQPDPRLDSSLSLNERYTTERFRRYYGDFAAVRRSYYIESERQLVDLWTELFDKLPELPWNSEQPPFRLFAAIGEGRRSEQKGTDIKVLMHLVYSLPNLTYFFERGRPDLYLLISGRALYVRLTLVITSTSLLTQKAITAPRDSRFYWPFTILMGALFEIDVYNKVDRRHLTPFWTMPMGKQVPPYDRDHNFLMRIRPRADVFEWMTAGPEPQDAYGFVHFVQQLLTVHAQNVLDSVEVMCPGVSNSIMQLGYTRMQQSRDLVVYDFVTIYKEMTKHPNFATAPFRTQLSPYLSRQVTSEGIAPTPPTPAHATTPMPELVSQ